MKIGILSRRGSLYSTARLRQAALDRGHEAVVVDYLRCYMNITSRRPKVLYAGKPLLFDANILVQQFIREAGGADIRAFVVGRRVVAAMKRQAAAGEFRSNLHRGGKAKQIKLTPEERKTAVKAAHTLGLQVAGVDMLRSAHGPLVIEVNASPGLEGIEKATGVDVAGTVIEFLERRVARRLPRETG